MRETILNENAIPEEIRQKEGMVALGYRGSVATGTFTEKTDDVDLWRIWTAPLKKHLCGGNLKTVQKESQMGTEIKWDLVTYELKHFFGLLLKGNPNMVTLLMLPDEMVIQSHWVWNVIMDQKKIFLAVEPFYCALLGFCMSQRKRYDRVNKKNIDDHTTPEMREIGFSPSAREQRIEEFGYDTHMAAHAIRWLRMGEEYLRTGGFDVDRSMIDADVLIEIKNGEITHDTVRWEWDNGLKYLEEAYKAGKCPHPPEPDVKAANNLLMDLLLLSNLKEIERHVGGNAKVFNENLSLTGA